MGVLHRKQSAVLGSIAAGLVMSLGASAAGAGEACTPVPPKDVQGNLALVHPGPSVADTYFEDNGCSWSGSDQLNGTDALVLDVSGMAGPATMTALTGDKSYVLVKIFGHFLDESCSRVPDADLKAGTSSSETPQTELITIPATAKWVVFDSDSGYPATDWNITLHSAGKECPVAPPKKKRKH